MAQATAPILDSTEAAVCRGAVSGRVLEMLRTLGAPWPDHPPCDPDQTPAAPSSGRRIVKTPGYCLT